jgi:hypothetical protein
MQKTLQSKAIWIPLAAACFAAVLLSQQAPQQPAPQVNPDLGFLDTPMEPGGKWHVHDPYRPHPKVVTPGSVLGAAPSDAIVLFDGKDLSKWSHEGRGADRGKLTDPKWVMGSGYFESVPATPDLITKEKFGDCQLHIEWSELADIQGTSQGRGNSGVLFMKRYEIQVLDPYNNVTYADGGAGAIYGQWPPLVNPGRKPGEWQTYDIVFKAPVFEGSNLVKPAYFTVFFNGVMVHDHQEAIGPMVYRQLARYTPHDAEDSLMLQSHNNRVRFRNIWIRRLAGYDQPEK